VWKLKSETNYPYGASLYVFLVSTVILNYKLCEVFTSSFVNRTYRARQRTSLRLFHEPI
jgi:hypothetical protein